MSIAMLRLFIVRYVYPGFIGPSHAASRPSDFSADALFLELPEAFFPGFEIQEGQQIAAVVQKQALHFFHRDFRRMAGLFDSDRSKGAGGLSKSADYRLKAYSSIHLPTHRHGFVGHKEILDFKRNYDSERDAE